MINIQNEIIENVSGGFDETMNKYFMKKHDQLSLLEHQKLEQVLFNTHDGEIYSNYDGDNNDKLCISHISDDCFFLIRTFLDCRSISVMQMTCRLFLIMCRQEAAIQLNYC